MTESAPTGTHFALHTDLYQVTMAAAYFGMAGDTVASFELFVREMPPDRGYLIAAGLEQALDYLAGFRFIEDEIDYLKNLGPMSHVPPAFFDHLAELRFTGDVWAMPEGTLFFAGEPVLRVTAPVIEAQLVETYLLSQINFQTLIATKASRIVYAADGRGVADFGSRRAHGPEAGVLAARAGYVGGCAATSNTYAGMRYGIPVTGTMAHSYVMAFDSEREAFERYLAVFPGNTTLLLDTYDTVNAARVAARFGQAVGGVRLDSGDIAALSRQVRQILNEAGMADTRIAASGDLNEFKIQRLLRDGAEIDLFGVGTELVTSRDAPVLPGVYKLVERQTGNERDYRLKLSTDKATLPGVKQVFRAVEGGRFTGDRIGLADEDTDGCVPLLERVMERGGLIGRPPAASEARQRAAGQLAALDPAVRRHREPAEYPVRISNELARLRDRIESEIRAERNES